MLILIDWIKIYLVLYLYFFNIDKFQVNVTNNFGYIFGYSVDVMFVPKIIFIRVSSNRYLDSEFHWSQVRLTQLYLIAIGIIQQELRIRKRDILPKQNIFIYLDQGHEFSAIYVYNSVLPSAI